MKKSVILFLFSLLFSFTGNSQIYNSKDSTFYSDSSFTKVYNGVSVSYYTLNGAVQNKANYINGKLHGEVIEYHENGKIARKLNFTDGKCQGEVLEFHSNGQIAKKMTYVNGIPNGELIKFHENGVIEAKTNYIEGDLQ